VLQLVSKDSVAPAEGEAQHTESRRNICSASRRNSRDACAAPELDCRSALVIKHFLRCSVAGLALAAVLHQLQKFDARIANPSFPPRTGPRVVIDAAHFNFAEETDAFVEMLRNDAADDRQFVVNTIRWLARVIP
jgi:hypothetical protein